MLSKRILGSILLLFLSLFVLFMSLMIYSDAALSGAIVNPRVAELEGAEMPKLLSASDLRLGGDFAPAAYVEKQTGVFSTTDLVNVFGAPLLSNTATVVSGNVSGSAGDAAQTVQRKAVIFTRDEKDETTQRLIEWCGYAKYAYRVSSVLPSVSDLSDYSLALFASYVPAAADAATLRTYTESGLTLLFTTLPDFKTLAGSTALCDLLGIEEAVRADFEVNGVHVYKDFFLTDQRIYTHDDIYGELDDMDITVDYYTLRAGYDVYATAVLDDQEEQGIVNEKMPPLLWRTATDDANVYVINSELFRGKALLGVVTAFVSHKDDVNLYPIVNAKTVNVLDFPWMGNENDSEVGSIYGHRLDTLSWDIMWPNIVQILYNFNHSGNFYVSAQADYDAPFEASSMNVAQYYYKQIRKLLSTMSLSLTQVSAADLETVLAANEAYFSENLPGYVFTALYAGDFDLDELAAKLRDDTNTFLQNVSVVLSDWQDGEPVLTSLTDDVLSVKLTTNGWDYEARNDIDMISLQTALGMSNQYVHISEMIYPQSEADRWNTRSITWSSSVTYFNDFEKMDYVTLDTLEDRVRSFLALNYTTVRAADTVTLRIENVTGDTYFVLRLLKDEIASIDGGEAEMLTDTAYLVTAHDSTVVFHLTPKDVLAD